MTPTAGLAYGEPVTPPPSLVSRPPRRGPFVGWPRAADAVLAAVVTVLTFTFVDGPGDTVSFRSPTEVPAAYAVLFVAAGVALYWRRRRPMVVLGVALVCWALQLGSAYSTGGAIVLVALYSAGKWAPDPKPAMWGVAPAIVLIVADGLLLGDPWGDIVFGAVVMEFAWYLGHRLRLRREAAARLAREREAEMRRIKSEERTRIARELHDVVAHRVSSMTVQAGAAKAVAAQDPEAALRAMGAVEEAGRQALDELRHLLGVLRLEAEVDGPGPQPGLADLARLTAQTRQLGVDVELSQDGVEPGTLPARVELSAYRIVQESLTNAIKHAGPGTAVRVHLHVGGDALLVEVVDDGPGAGNDEGTTAGHGIVGMRERAALLGGTLDAGPVASGGFAVTARLPLHGPSA